MKKRDESKRQKVDQRLISRLGIYLIVMVVMLAVIVVEVLRGVFSIQWALVGIIIGLVVGTIVSRVYSLSWDEETNNVIGEIDRIGALILVGYLIFIFTKSYFLGYEVQGANLFAVILGITAGTMLGRVLSTKRSIEKILKVVKIQ
jgi:cation transport ATPase